MLREITLSHRAVGLIAVILVATLALAAATTHATSPAMQGDSVAVEGLLATGPLLSYQGRLADPATGAPKNGTFAATFKLYGASSGGTALWTETKNLSASEGLFATLLGDTTPLRLDIFDGRDLWLGVQLSPDLEASPRMQLAYSPYSVWAITASKAADADSLGGSPAATYRDAGALAAGTLSTDRYRAIDDLSTEGYLGSAPGDLALNNGVLQSTLNADLLDGAHSASFAPAGHQHDASSITSGNLSIDRFSAIDDLDAGGNVGMGAGQVAPGAHGHFGSVWSASAPDAFALLVENQGAGDGIRSTSADTRPNWGAIYAVNSSTGTGVLGISNGGYGVFGSSGAGTGVYGWSNTGWAGFFEGNVRVNGSLSKAGGGFKIDHPLDPENKTLNHSFVESPDMKDLYDGVATLDSNGEAWVELPDWFGALNRDFRYQLTAIGAPGPNLYIASEIQNNRFQIAGGVPGSRVSWQVTGTRQDAWANANRLQVEEPKAAEDQGKYLNPEAYGLPPEAGQDNPRWQLESSAPSNPAGGALPGK